MAYYFNQPEESKNKFRQCLKTLQRLQWLQLRFRASLRAEYRKRNGKATEFFAFFKDFFSLRSKPRARIRTTALSTSQSPPELKARASAAPGPSGGPVSDWDPRCPQATDAILQPLPLGQSEQGKSCFVKLYHLLVSSLKCNFKFNFKFWQPTTKCDLSYYNNFEQMKYSSNTLSFKES